MQDDKYFKIETGVELLPHRPSSRAIEFQKLLTMNIGDSMLIPGSSIKKFSYLYEIASRAGKNIVMRQADKDSIRVYLVDRKRKVSRSCQNTEQTKLEIIEFVKIHRRFPRYNASRSKERKLYGQYKALCMPSQKLYQPDFKALVYALRESLNAESK